MLSNDILRELNIIFEDADCNIENLELQKFIKKHILWEHIAIIDSLTQIKMNNYTHELRLKYCQSEDTDFLPHIKIMRSGVDKNGYGLYADRF